MVFEHFRTHFEICKDQNSNNFKFGTFEGHGLGSLLDISIESLEAIQENLNKTYSSNSIGSISSDQNNSTSADSSNDEFSLAKAPVYLPKYNATRKLRKQIRNFVNDMDSKHNVTMPELMMNILHVLTEYEDYEEVFGAFGYIKIENITKYSSILR